MKTMPASRCSAFAPAEGPGPPSGGAPRVITGRSIPPTPRTRPVNMPWRMMERPTSWTQNCSSPIAAPTPARIDPPLPINKASTTQTKLFGTRGAAPGARKRLTANWINTPIRRSQGICESAHFSYQAPTVIAIGARTPTAICQAAGGAVAVRRGMSVKRNPTAKQVMKPSICAKAWKIDRYSPITPVARSSQWSTPAQASRHAEREEDAIRIGAPAGESARRRGQLDGHGAMDRPGPRPRTTLCSRPAALPSSVRM